MLVLKRVFFLCFSKKKHTEQTVAETEKLRFRLS